MIRRAAAARPRRRRRTRLVPWLLVALAVGSFGVGGKFVTMYAFAAAGTSAYDDSRYRAAERSFANLEVLNVVDPWRAHLGLGDARYRRGDLHGAETAFRRALELHPASCEIRFNLAVTIEAIGDDALATDRGRETAEAVARYREALDVATEGDCDPQHAGETAIRLDDTAARIEEKLDALDDDSPGEDPPEAAPPLESDRGDSEQLDELEDRNETGAAQREASRDDPGGIPPSGHSNW